MTLRKPRLLATRRGGRFKRLNILAAAVLSITLSPLAIGSASASAETDRLNPGETLSVNQRLVSPSGQYVLVMQGDGNLVEYAPGNLAVWASGTATPDSVVSMQSDGNLVVIAPGNQPVWATGTSGFPGADLELQDDGNLVVYATGHAACWASGSGSTDGTGSPSGPGSSPSSGSDLAHSIVDQARGERDNPAHNHEAGGHDCNFYSTALGVGHGPKGYCSNGWHSEQWCADFVRWVWRKSGANTVGLGTAVASFQRSGYHKGVDGIQPGDAVLYRPYSHVAIVVGVSSTSITVIGGNSGAANVRQTTSSLGTFIGYLRPHA